MLKTRRVRISAIYATLK